MPAVQIQVTGALSGPTHLQKAFPQVTFCFKPDTQISPCLTLQDELIGTHEKMTEDNSVWKGEGMSFISIGICEN